LGAANQTTRINVTKFGEVGIIWKKKNQHLGPHFHPVGDITDWNLFIPLNPVNVNDKLVISFAHAELFGHIVDTSNSPNETLMELSKSKKNERCLYTITIESQYDS
jgi:hypothetical protein